MIDPSPQSNIRDLLAEMPAEHNWGWVIYRCTYTDDSTWARFRARVEEDSRENIKNSDAPEIAERLEWTWVEDRALDGVSTAALRERFRAWTAEQVACQPGDYDPPVIPRFRYFIKVDQEALDSLAESLPIKTRWLDDAFVKFVDGHWEPSAENEQAKDDEEEQEELQPIEGCTEEDVGWMRIVPDMINASFYDTLSGDPNAWFVFYERPPKKSFRHNIAPTRLTRLINRADRGDEAAAEEMLEALAETRAVFSYLNQDVVMTRVDNTVNNIRRALNIIETSIPSAEGLVSHWDAFYPYYMAQVSDLACSRQTTQIQEIRRRLGVNTSHFVPRELAELTALENDIPKDDIPL